MSFTLGKAMNPPTVFLASRFELRDRFDPEMVLFRRKTHSFKYPGSKLRSFYAEPPQYGAGERGLERESDDQPRYIRITDIDEYGILTDGLGATAATVGQRYILGDGDLLLARSGNTVGKSYLHKRAHAPAVCFFAGYLIRFRFRSTEILPEYAFAFTQLPYYKEWVRAVQRAAGQPNINAREYSNLDIPAAPISVQKKIITLLQDAYAAKRRRDDEARSLLFGIDGVLLAELGISPKAEPPSTLKSRMFQRDFSTVSGKRIDPASNWKHLSFDGGKFPLRRLRDVALINPITRFPKSAPGTQVSFVPMDAVSDVFGEIADIQTRPIEEAGSYTPFQNGDVIWAKITPCMENGKAAVADGLVEGVGYGSTEFHVFRRRSLELCPYFLHHLLRLRTVREHARRNFTGSSGHQRVDEDFFYRMEIPFPPMKIQERIAAQTKATIAQARKLFADADADLEKAKGDIEALILGKEACV